MPEVHTKHTCIHEKQERAYFWVAAIRRLPKIIGLFYRSLLQKRPIIYRGLLQKTKMNLSEMSMGWLRFVGSLKFQISFAGFSLFYGALLQKRPIIFRSLLIVATSYVVPMMCVYAIVRMLCRVCVCYCAYAVSCVCI